MRTAFTCRIYNKIEEVFEPRNKGKSTIEITDFRTITGLFPVISIVDYLYFRGQKQYTW